MKEKKPLSCSSCSTVWDKCGETNCWAEPDQGPAKPAYCPSDPHADIIVKSFAKYAGDDEDARLAKVAARVEGLCYQPIPGSDAVNARWNRVEDLLALCKLMEYKKIGIATCIGLLDETKRLSDILIAQGFEPYSACCKAGSIDKLKLDLKESDKVRPGTFEPACNPIAQAEILNTEGMDMNVIMGLCVGHDMLFNKYSQAPVTTLVVKDRVTGHNPVSVLYGQNFYYKRLQKQPMVIPDE
ncbi:MAG: hypothetical protein C0615_01615 [Desulfuromonas sp.]|nr:MAG: hypothetical protein C0615_01615 [Desulfuromonas sp.]